MGPQDRLDLAVRTVHRLVRVLGRTDCHFAFLGDGESRAAAEQLAAQLDVRDWITFTGWVDADTVAEYLSVADMGIEPNLEEIVSPVKCMEYMAHGLPFVCFDVWETLVVAGGAAAYARPGDVEGMARLVDQLLDDAPGRAAMGRHGRRRVAETLAWERQEESYLDVYRRLLGGRFPEPREHRSGDRVAVGG
jgi:glycosyltransferase involved in cell wall biosynthesis